MHTIESSLFHRCIPPRKAGNTRHPTIIMLHGRGADEEDLPGLARYFDPELMVISVRAPYPFLQGGGFTWYEFDVGGSPEPVMFRTSYEKLFTFVDDILGAYPIDPTRLFLLGFSMGTVMSHSLALTRPGLFKGILANSGYIPEGTHLNFAWKQLAGLNVFLAHGIHDPVIPVQLSRHAKGLYEQSPAILEYHEYAMAHQISQESIADMSEWLSRLVTHGDTNA